MPGGCEETPAKHSNAGRSTTDGRHHCGPVIFVGVRVTKVPTELKFDEKAGRLYWPSPFIRCELHSRKIEQGNLDRARQYTAKT